MQSIIVMATSAEKIPEYIVQYTCYGCQTPVCIYTGTKSCTCTTQIKMPAKEFQDTVCAKCGIICSSMMRYGTDCYYHCGGYPLNKLKQLMAERHGSFYIDQPNQSNLTMQSSIKKCKPMRSVFVPDDDFD